MGHDRTAFHSGTQSDLVIDGLRPALIALDARLANLERLGHSVAQFNANAIARRTVAGSFTANSRLRVVVASSRTADAVLKRTTATSFSADAIARRTISSSLVGDAITRQTLGGSLTSDAVMVPRVGFLTADAITLRTVTGTITGDAVVTPMVGSGSLTADAIHRRTSSGSMTADATIEEEGLTQAYIGTNAVGAANETPSALQYIAQKVVVATDCLITDIEVYVQFTGDAELGIGGVYLYGDNGSGTAPLEMLSLNELNARLMLEQTSTGPRTARWIGAAIGRWVVAGTYWLVVRLDDTGSWQTFYDTGGADLKMTGGGTSPFEGIGDWGLWTSTDSTRTYSIRANTLR